MKLLGEEIGAKQKRINIFEKDTKNIRKELQGTISCLDFSYICSLFLVANNKSILHHENVQKRKLKNLSQISLKEFITQPSFTCSKLFIQTLELGVKYFQS